MLARIKETLELGKPARSVALTAEEAPLVSGLQLLTAKPLIYAANVNEDELADQGAKNKHVVALKALADAEGARVVVVSAQVMSELSELGPEEAAEYLASMGVATGQGGLEGLIQASYYALGLRTYYTSGEKETRAWTIKAGMTAPQAAGVIHR